MEQPQAFCFYVAEQRMAPWRATMLEAKEDAIDAGYGDRDEFNPDIIWLTVPGEIYVTFEKVEIEERPVRLHSKKPAAYPSRIDRIIARREGREAA